MGGKAGKKSKKASPSTATKPGLSFELRATRAMSQLLVGHKVEHDQRLPTEYGIERQFDVVALANAVVDRAYEAREHGRRVDIGQIEGFAKKVDKLIEKPSSAGVISSRGFSKSAVTWVQHYQATERMRELYTLHASTPQDWNSDLRQLATHSDVKSVRPKSVRLRSSVDPSADSTSVALAVDRRGGFLYATDGAVIGNLIDLLNTVMGEAQKAHELGTKTMRLPDGAHARIGEQLVPVAVVEVEFEELSLSANTLIDFTGLFPDVLRDVLSDRSWLIADPERALKASRAGLDLTLAFPEEGDAAFVDISDLAAPASTADAEASLRATVTSLSLKVALGALHALSSPDEAPPTALLEDLAAARERFAARDLLEAARLYQATLKMGTALEALCNLAYVAVENKDYNKAIMFSAHAARVFPFEPHGFVNLAASLSAAGRPDEACAVLKNARVLHGPDVLFRRQEAELLFLDGKIQDAANVFYSLTLDDPTDVKSLANLAKCEARLGDDAHAAWDGYRAFLLTPTDARIAEFAAKAATRSSQWSTVLEIAKMALQVQALTAPLCRFAVTAAIERKEYAAALGWLERLPTSDWSQEEWAVRGRLQSATGDHAGAIESLQHASSRSHGTLAEVDSLWLAESMTKLERYREALDVLTDIVHAEADVIRALALTGLGLGDELTKVLARIEDARANALAVECLDRLWRQRNHVALIAVTRWFLKRQSSAPEVLLRQASALAAKALDSRDPADLEEASQRLIRARAAGASAAELQPSEVFLAMARGGEDQAIAEASKLDPRTRSDMLVMLMTRARGLRMFRLVADLADRCLLANERPTLFDLEMVALERLLCAFHLGQPRSALDIALRVTRLPTDVRGRLASAVVAYVDKKLDVCAELLAPMLAEDPLPAEALWLLSQCLAESLRFGDLRELCATQLTDFEPLAEWAAQRSPNRSLTPLDISMAMASVIPQSPELVAIAQMGSVMVVVPGIDWVNALTNARQHAPNATTLWIARLSYPAQLLRSFFRFQPPSAGAPPT